MFALGEGGWVEHDGVVLALCRRVVFEEIKGIAFDPLQVASVQYCILFRHFQGWTRTIDAGHARTLACEVKGESPLVAKDVERFAVTALGGRRVVFPLIEKCPSLLTLQSVVVKTDPFGRAAAPLVGVHG